VFYFPSLKADIAKYLPSKISKAAVAIKFTEQKRRHDGCRVLADKFILH
jgi:hypothetical protein